MPRIWFLILWHQVVVGEDRKSRSSDCLFVLTSSSLHKFDLALHMMLFPYCMCLLIKNKKIGRLVARWFLLRYVSYLMYFIWVISSLCIDELFLHMVEIISLTYIKFSCSLVMIDSYYPHAMKMCTIQGSLKIHLSFSDFLFLDFLD
jgi:hypothetical protein